MGHRIVAIDILPGRMLFGFRAMLALLLGLTSLMMVILALALPRTTTIILIQAFAGFALLDGLLCLATAIRPVHLPTPRGLIALEGVVEIITAIVAFFLVSNLDERARGILPLVATWAIVTGILELAWALSIRVSRGRVLLVIAGILSIAFGVFLFGAPRPDLLTAMWRFAVYILLLGVLRALVTFNARGR